MNNNLSVNDINRQFAYIINDIISSNVSIMEVESLFEKEYRYRKHREFTYPGQIQLYLFFYSFAYRFLNIPKHKEVLNKIGVSPISILSEAAEIISVRNFIESDLIKELKPSILKTNLLHSQLELKKFLESNNNQFLITFFEYIDEYTKEYNYYMEYKAGKSAGFYHNFSFINFHVRPFTESESIRRVNNEIDRDFEYYRQSGENFRHSLREIYSEHRFLYEKIAQKISDDFLNNKLMKTIAFFGGGSLSTDYKTEQLMKKFGLSGRKSDYRALVERMEMDPDFRRANFGSDYVDFGDFSFGNPAHRKSKTNNNCYIATLVYQDINHPKVSLLRTYRDEILMNSFLGRLFVRIYYSISPNIVKILSPFPKLHNLIRYVLDRFIKKIQKYK